VDAELRVDQLGELSCRLPCFAHRRPFPWMSDRAR
jgi:hypothetical protein